MRSMFRIVLAAVVTAAAWAPGAWAQCPSGQLDFDFDLGTLDDLLGNVLVDENNTNLWAGGASPIWTKIPGQVGPGFTGVDNDDNGIDDDDHFDLLAAIINGSDTEVVQNLNPANVAAIRDAFSAAKARVRTFEVTLNNIKLDATALGFVSLQRTLSVTTGATTCISVPVAGDQCFDVPPLWGPGGILSDVDPLLEERLVNLAAGYLTIGDAKGIAYFQNVLSQVTLAALNALVPQLLEGLGKKSVDGGLTKAVDCNQIDPIDTDFSITDPLQVDGNIRVEAIDICNALNNFINKFSCSNGFSCQTALLAASGNLNGAGTNNLTSYLNASRDRQAWMINESISNPPLQVTTNPVSQTVSAGTPTTMSMTFTGGKSGATRNYLWQTMDGEAFSPIATVATSEQLSLAYPVPADSGLYTGVVCDGLWQRRSQPAQLTVNAGTFRITIQPQGVAGLVPGTQLQLTVQVRGGNTAPSYQWQFNDGGGFVNVGTNSPEFTIPSVDLPDGGTYRCVITGDSTLTTDEAVVEVVDSIRFQTPPQDRAVYVGTPVSFTPEIIGAVIGSISYQWFKNDVAIDGATDSTLEFGSAQLSDNGNYSLRISDDVYTVFSQEASLEVALQPSITQQPVGGPGFEGNDYTFSVTVSGGLTFLNYQWFFIPAAGGEPQPVGENSPVLELTDLVTDDEGNYFVVINDLLTELTSNQALLEIFPPFDIVGQPESTVKYIGDGHTFTVVVEGGTGTLNYQWQKNGVNVGPNNPSYTIDPLSVSDIGTYRCVVSDDNGTNTSDEATLDVKEHLSFTQEPLDTGAYVGQTVTLTADASGGIGDITYRWKRGSIVVGFGKTLTIADATQSATGKYKCEVSDATETITSRDAQVAVVPPVTFSVQPQDAYRFEGNSVQFSVTANGGLGQLNYRWLKDNVEMPNTGPTLFLEKVFLADNGTYRCEVTDDLFTTSSTGARLFVFEALPTEGVDLSATLNGDQVVPTSGSGQETFAVGTLKPNNGVYDMIMNVTHFVPGVTGAKIRKANIGSNGPVVFNLGNGVSPIIVSEGLTAPQAAELLGGFYYVTIETTTFPDGVIRGQIQATVPEPEGETVVCSSNNLISGELTPCSLHYDRIQSSAKSLTCSAIADETVNDNMAYNAIVFTSVAPVNFTAAVQGGGTSLSDPVLSLYCGVFDPLSPELNLVAYDDDDGTSPGMPAFKSGDALALSVGSTYTLVISTFRGSTTPSDNAEIPLDTDIVGDYGTYAVCLPATAVVSEVLGGGGEDCFVAISEGEGGNEGEGEGIVDGSNEGEGEGGGEGIVEGSDGEIEGEGEGIVDGSIEGEGEGEGGGEGQAPAGYSADADGSGWLSLEELLRVIQLFNAGAYYCAEVPEEGGDAYSLTDEGLAFGDGDCVYHSGDYREPFGVFQLSELLRTIQFFNLGGVIACPNGDTEDGFCIPEVPLR
ncbi:MAG: CHRD domain-containing protein [Candidatus Hydrogenedens sp.]|nr:CHRD domain-containing protein [Candidatus Hydrogenedens sp.]